ncbi:alpha/beta fold hydrolase [Patescibacteria group bacterium]
MKNLLLKRKLIKINGKTLSYWTNTTKKYQDAYMFLAGGVEKGKFFKKYVESLPNKKTKIVIPDYPGRGGSDPIANNNLDFIANQLQKLIKKLKLNKVTLIGYSFGGALAHEMVKINEKPISKVIVLASGEFFTDFQKLLIKVLFIPPKYSELLRKIYRQAIVKYFPLFDSFPQKNLKSIVEQWLSIINFKLESNKKMDIPLTLINLRRDNIVKKDSTLKFREIYRNIEVVELDLPHTWKFDETIKKKMFIRIINNHTNYFK